MEGTPGYLKDFGSHFTVFLKFSTLAVFLVYIGIPIFVKANQWILPKIVFSNIVQWPPFINLSNPSDFGLNCTKYHRLHVDEGIDIGAWHILPENLHTANLDVMSDDYEESLRGSNMVFLYLHGNTGTRASNHRLQLYKLLVRLNYHVFTIDYRGYGDSTGSPTENGVVADALFAYTWLKNKTRPGNVFIWGHSLGTGVTTKLAKKLGQEGEYPAGIVLESPFNNIREAAFHHPFATPFRMLPWFEWIFVDGIQKQGVFFSSDQNIESVAPHILILHAKDDNIVPHQLGKKLYNHAKNSRNTNTGDVEFVSFEGHLGYGHKLLYQSPELPELVTRFVAKCNGS